MLVQLAKVTETVVEGKANFVYEFGMVQGHPVNHQFKAAIFQFASAERIEGYEVGKNYVLVASLASEQMKLTSGGD